MEYYLAIKRNAFELLEHYSSNKYLVSTHSVPAPCASDAAKNSTTLVSKQLTVRK